MSLDVKISTISESEIKNSGSHLNFRSSPSKDLEDHGQSQFQGPNPFPTTFVGKAFLENSILRSYPGVSIFIRHPVYTITLLYSVNFLS